MFRASAEASVEIHAPILRVWQVMTDFSAYGEWNPFIFRVDETTPSPCAVGSRLILHVRWTNGGGAKSAEVVTRFDAPHNGTANLSYRFSGALSDLYLVRAVREQTLEQTSNGNTIYRTRENFRGLLTALLPLKKVQAGFEAHAQALKTRAESP